MVKAPNIKIKIIRLLQANLTNKQIATTLNISLNHVGKTISLLKKNALISKRKLTEKGEDFLKSYLMLYPLEKSNFLEHPLRLHGLGFKLKVLGTRLAWESERNKIVTLNKKPYGAKEIRLKGWNKYQYSLNRIMVKTTPKSVEIWYLYSIEAGTHEQASLKAMQDLLESHIPQVEKLFNIELIKENHISIEILNQHHANIENSLAKMYRKEGRTLHIYLGGELHYLIDFSHSINEFEAVHPIDAAQDYGNMMRFFKPISEGNFLAPDEQATLNQKLVRRIKSLKKVLKQSGLIQDNKTENPKDKPDYVG